uniref:Uncharacterized protein n=2 Tax=Pyramimonas obovata TaxID=1411642 RepID=A0A7S0MRY7_9CHLO|mmetsp:Transcript_11913/g.25060  ORF Transcript_11913/g.25060 Transcript_11913/m.25060 type:complete len:354 (+) Transcript_11913:599-1660(+)
MLCRFQHVIAAIPMPSSMFSRALRCAPAAALLMPRAMVGGIVPASNVTDALVQQNFGTLHVQDGWRTNEYQSTGTAMWRFVGFAGLSLGLAESAKCAGDEQPVAAHAEASSSRTSSMPAWWDAFIKSNEEANEYAKKLEVPMSIKSWAHTVSKTLPQEWKQSDAVVWPSMHRFAPDPSLSFKPDHDKYNMCRPKTVVTFWDPHVFFPQYCGTPRCIACESGSGVHADGWPAASDRAGFKPVIKTGGLDWIYCRGYRHKSCPAAAKLKSGEDGTTTFNTLHKKYLGQLDDHVLQQLPGRFTKSMGIEMSLVYTIMAAMPKGTASGVAEMLKQASNNMLVDQTLSYVAHCDAYNR